MGIGLGVESVSQSHPMGFLSVKQRFRDLGAIALEQKGHKFLGEIWYNSVLDWVSALLLLLSDLYANCGLQKNMG